MPITCQSREPAGLDGLGQHVRAQTFEHRLQHVRFAIGSRTLPRCLRKAARARSGQHPSAADRHYSNRPHLHSGPASGWRRPS
jgi:hypothetical protein